MGLWRKKQKAPPAEPVAEFTLAEVRREAPVAAALAGAPEVWRNCSYRDDEDDPDELDIPLDDLLHSAWVSAHHGMWELGLGDELFAALDLEAPAEEDAILATLLAHPAVADGYHEDREVYRFSGEIGRLDAAALAASALVAGHRSALRRAGLA